MKSPITGKKMILQEEVLVTTFKEEEIRYLQKNYLCIDSGETFTTTELDEINLKRIEVEFSKLNK